MSNAGGPVTCRVSEGVGQITFNKPQSLNAMDIEMAEGFLEGVRDLVADETVRVIVLSSEGRSFMAGGDLAYFRDADDRGEAARTLIGLAHETIAILRASQQITVASVQGAAAGAGMSISIGCDFVVAAENAVFNSAYARIGTTPDCGGSWLLPRLVGPRKALEIALLCESIDAADALRLGLVNKVVPLADLKAETDALVGRLVSGSAPAQQNIKRLVTGALDTSLEQQLKAEIDSFAECAQTAEFDAAITAFFDKKNK